MDTATVSTMPQSAFKPGVNIAVGTHSTQRGTADVTLDADTIVIRDIDPDRIQDHRWVVSGVEAGQDHTAVFGIIPSSNSAQTTNFSTIYAAKGDTPRVYTANVNSALGMARSTRKAAIEGLEIFRLDSQWAVIMITASPPTPSTMQVIVRPSTQPEGTDTLAVTVFDVSIRDANRGQ
ncbi:hypothetical protein [uncultured Algimonas sp.]|uniref:hypothetical protein n=1 Tax=uncultured Algimonas sp. TaxID=1547920 RepID=UPI00262C48F7|nr:hypothetical protein [uncultured Algimonas sp.]